MNRFFLTCLFVFALLFFIAGTCPADPEQGQWEFTMETEIPGMPMKMPPTTFKQCVTKDDLIPQDKQPGRQCEIKEMKRNGDTITWTAVCDTGAAKGTSKGEVKYVGKKMTGAIEMQMQGMTMISKVKGHWLGPCE